MNRLVVRAFVSAAVCLVLWLGPFLAVAGGAPGAAAAPAQPLWSRQVDKKSYVGSLHVVDGVVVAGTESGRVFGLDARTGRTLWNNGTRSRRAGTCGWP
jgi:PQQ-like domain